MRLYYDLHIHSCLSPCGDSDMLPQNIAGMAHIKGLDVIALTDHNSSQNCPAFLKSAAEYGLVALPGMELTTMEEVHVLCLFEKLEDALLWDRYVYERLIKVPNNPKIFGSQDIISDDGLITGNVEPLLINATDIEFSKVHSLLKNFNGIMIPAHIDGGSNSLLSNLGFVPFDSEFTCYELKNFSLHGKIESEQTYLENCRCIKNSDAHYLYDISEPLHFIETDDRTPRAVIDALSSPELLK